jgi:hypothetical protein
MESTFLYTPFKTDIDMYSYVKDNLPKFNYDSFISGSFAGACGIIVSYPLDTIKTYHQTTNTKNIYEAFKSIMKKHKIKFIHKGLYRGMTFPLFGMGMEKAIVFGVQENFYKLKIISDHYTNIFASGVVSGLCCGLVVTPIEKFKILMQNNHSYHTAYKSIFNNRTLYTSSTLLYRGYASTMIREGLGFGIYFYVYNNLKDMHNQQFNIKFNPLYAMMYGALSGTSAWAIMYPSDQIKTIQQYHNHKFTQAIKHIYKNHGLVGFYRGYIPALLRASILHAGVFGGLELFNLLSK